MADADDNRSVAAAVAETLAGIELTAQDRAVSRVIEGYAVLLDRAAWNAALADRALRKAGDDPELAEMVGALKAKLAERTAWENLGPKLLAALDSVGATPKGRASLGKPAGAAGGGKLAALRAGVS